MEFPDPSPSLTEGLSAKKKSSFDHPVSPPDLAAQCSPFAPLCSLYQTPSTVPHFEITKNGFAMFSAYPRWLRFAFPVGFVSQDPLATTIVTPGKTLPDQPAD
jgi:hypothetical protein